MRISHITIDLCLWNQSSHGVHNNNIHCARAHHRLCDLKRLLSIIRLGYVQIINIYSYILRINRIERMLCINKSRNATPLLHLRCHVQCHCRLTT